MEARKTSKLSGISVQNVQAKQNKHAKCPDPPDLASVAGELGAPERFDGPRKQQNRDKKEDHLINCAEVIFL